MLKTTCISVRLRGTDIDKIKSIARRLDVSDSEIFRFGIRLAMSRLLPLLDEKACGFRVLPVFVENDAELVRHFDIDKIKSIARRLDVSDSEIFRFGIRLAMSRLLPLLDEKACGFRVLPVFVENDAELVRHFDMDATHLERVINAQCMDDASRVDQADLNLLTLHGLPSDYLRLRLQELVGESVEGQAVWKALRSYLYRKYGRGIDNVDNQPNHPADEAYGSAAQKLLHQS